MKKKKIIYWIATIWLSLGMLSTGIVQLSGMKSEAVFMNNLGYPDYFMKLLGACKIVGVIVLLVPKVTVLKEWAYAGFTFIMAGAVFSHIATDSVNKIFPSALLLALVVVSWYFRPDNRKIIHP